MKMVRRTRWYDWLGSGLLLLLSLFLFFVSDYGRKHGTTPKDELLVLTGRAQNAHESVNGSSRYLWFTVQGHTTEYGNDRPSYNQVAAAALTGRIVTIGVSTKQETFFKRDGWVPMYTFTLDGEELLSYEHTVTHGYRGSNASWTLAVMLFAGSLWSLWTAWKNRDSQDLSPRERAVFMLAPERAKNGGIICSVLIYGALLYATLQPECQAVIQKAAGEHPLRMPCWLFSFLFITLLFIPAPLGIFHHMRCLIARQVIGSTAAYQSILKDDPDLRRSQRIARIVLSFYVLLMVGWIAYASARDI